MEITIEWRHLDSGGATCDRCMDTGEILRGEISRLERELSRKGHRLVLRETLLGKDEIEESNSVFLNGTAIEEIVALEVVSNYCASCSDLLDEEVRCRAVVFEGRQYDEIPAAAVRKALYVCLGEEPKAPAFSMNQSNSGSCC